VNHGNQSVTTALSAVEMSRINNRDPPALRSSVQRAVPHQQPARADGGAARACLP